MTCDDCQAILIDIARGADVDRVLRDDARRHAALCARCGEQQPEQEWLTEQIRAIAAADAPRQAPDRVEIAVLAAWRAEYAAAAPVAPASVAASPAPMQAPKRWLLPAVAVASFAAAALATIFVWPSPHRASGSRAGSAAVASSVAVNHAAARSSTTTGTTTASQRNSESKGDGALAASTQPEPSEAADAAMSSETASTTTARPRPAVSDDGAESVLARAETSDTEFLPLPYVEPLRATEARTVVRVSMTSGDELILGLLPADRRNGQPFEADVLVGEDGVARAIRVVR